MIVAFGLFFVACAIVLVVMLAHFSRQLKRIAAVGDFLKEMGEIVYLCAKVDITAGRPFHWRYDTLAAVSFTSIVHSRKALKPENFWDDLSFLQPEGTPPV